MVETVPVDTAKPDEVFTSCGDLAKDGYEGYKCTPASRCEDGYIVSDAIDDLFSAKSENSNLRNDELDASNYGCETAPRSEYDDYYYDENYDYEGDEQEMICCRDPQFFGKGIVHEIYITSRIGMLDILHISSIIIRCNYYYRQKQKGGRRRKVPIRLYWMGRTWF